MAASSSKVFARASFAWTALVASVAVAGWATAGMVVLGAYTTGPLWIALAVGGPIPAVLLAVLAGFFFGLDAKTSPPTDPG